MQSMQIVCMHDDKMCLTSPSASGVMNEPEVIYFSRLEYFIKNAKHHLN